MARSNSFKSGFVNSISKMATYEDILQYSAAQVQCGLCNIFIDNNRQCIETHLQKVLHSDLYLQRMMIQNNIVKVHNEAYCSICEQNLSKHSIKTHISSVNHVNAMRKIHVLIEGEYIDLPDINSPHSPSAYCVICDSNVGFTVKSINNHIDSKMHERTRSITVQPLNGIFSVEGTNDELWCKICDVYFNNIVEEILDHVDHNDSHINEIKEIEDIIAGEGITIDDYLTISSEDRATCNHCNVKIPCNYHNLRQHIKGDRHKNQKLL